MPKRAASEPKRQRTARASGRSAQCANKPPAPQVAIEMTGLSQRRSALEARQTQRDLARRCQLFLSPTSSHRAGRDDVWLVISEPHARASQYDASRSASRSVETANRHRMRLPRFAVDGYSDSAWPITTQSYRLTPSKSWRPAETDGSNAMRDRGEMYANAKLIDELKHGGFASGQLQRSDCTRSVCGCSIPPPCLTRDKGQTNVEAAEIYNSCHNGWPILNDSDHRPRSMRPAGYTGH